MKLFILILLYISVVWSETTHKSVHKSISIALHSKWKETPIYLEIIEFIAQENSQFIWTFIDLMRKQLDDKELNELSNGQQYEVGIDLAEQILDSPSKLSILKFSLSLRVFSPRVTMFNQISYDLLNQQNSLNECDAFVEFSIPSEQTIVDNYDRFTCQLSQAKNTLNAVFKQNNINMTHPILYKLDHIYQSSQSNTNIIVILYGNIGLKSFHDFNDYLKQLAKEGLIKYVIRHYVRNSVENKVSLSGYGVELAIKSTEYKAQDDTRVKGEEVPNSVLEKHDEHTKRDEVDGFIFYKLKSTFPTKTDKLDELHNHLLDNTKEIVTLKVWQLQEISLQAAKKVLDSSNSEPLSVLRDISQNFPTEARSLININVNSEMKKEIERNQQLFMQNLNLGTGDSALFINGLYFDAETIDVFSLLDIFNNELKLIEGLHRFVDGDIEALKKLIKMDINKNKQDYQIDIRDGAVIYINDVENDKMYRNWPSSLQDMLRPTYPGMLRNVRKNMYHLVLILDPSKKESYDILKLAESFYVHKAPVRIGIVFSVSPNSSIDGFKDSGVACLEAFNFISQDKTPYEGLSFITDVIATISNDKSNSMRDLTPDDVINQFKSKYKNEDLDLIFGADSDYDTGRKLAEEFIQRTGIGQPIKALLNGVVLKETHLNAEQFEEVVLTEIMKQTITIQKAIYKGEITDSNDMLEWLMSQKTVLPRINHLILNSEEADNSNKYIDFNGDPSPFKNLAVVKNLSIHDIELAVYASLKYTKTNKDKCNPITVWLAANYETKIGRDMLTDAITHLRSNSLAMRIAFIYNGFGSVSKIIESAISVIDSSTNFVHFLLKFLKDIKDLNVSEEASDKIYEIALLHLNSDYHKKFNNIYNSLNAESIIFALHNDFCAKILNIGANESAVVVNGRVIQIPIDEPFNEDDFNLLEKYFMSSFTDKILSELNIDEKYDSERCSDLVMKINSISLANPQSKTRHDIKFFSDQHSVLNLEPTHPNIPFIDVTVILDPLTRGAQKLTPILIAFQKVFNLKIKLFFNCVEKHSEMPLKSFYRFVINTEPIFSNDGQLSISRAFFSSMPTTPLLTLGMAIPDNWMVESTKAVYDLDNIHLADIEENEIWAYYELEHLLLEGHCFEQSSGNPPRGLQFTLGSTSTPVLVDTIVMANLGYFQLKANPGSWILRLRQGRSDDIYSIISHEGTDSHSNAKDVVSLISSFKSHVIKIRVNKKVGKQNEELLYDSEEEDYDDVNSLWNSFSWSSTPKKKSDANITNDMDANRINIFSVATGHLYERLMRIMMLSVLKNTNTSVKFWLLKNYLSPSFKEVLPYMAHTYNFEYELVQYKWPRWLHQQTEKQRIIWGYKILFLDVLFPLDVKKIIFVDADQVVRTDLKELRDLDLEGAPYGYTPFCDSRTDMEGYRFWKTGYWSTHLHNRRYHISALYVVDLHKFRRIAAGDRLRGQYQGLSQDPNSLSNLDQDLPNNMIHQVSIKSLPQDWLWCETWCSDESKKTAKTIDLCNNPKTKEPKLTAARRILPEWEGYDNEIKALIKQFEEAKNNGTINDILKQHISSFKQTVTSNEIHHQHREL